LRKADVEDSSELSRVRARAASTPKYQEQHEEPAVGMLRHELDVEPGPSVDSSHCG
jgi:hypothetical protein